MKPRGALARNSDLIRLRFGGDFVLEYSSCWGWMCHPLAERHVLPAAGRLFLVPVTQLHLERSAGGVQGREHLDFCNTWDCFLGGAWVLVLGPSLSFPFSSSYPFSFALPSSLSLLGK